MYQCLTRVLENSNCEGSVDRWEITQEYIQGVACFKVFKENSHGHSGTGKHWRSAEDFHVDDNV